MAWSILPFVLLFLFVASICNSPRAQDAEPSPTDSVVKLVVLNVDSGTLEVTGITVSVEASEGKTRNFDLTDWIGDPQPMSAPSWSKPYISTFGKQNAYVVTRHADDDNRLHHFDPFDSEAEITTTKLGELSPTALIEAGTLLCIGATDEVRTIDLSSEKPETKQVHKRKGNEDLPEEVRHRKVVDAFAWCGDLLVAVDDVVTPKYAFVFKQSEEGLVYLYTADLPMSPNSQYFEAAGTNGRLAVAAQYGIRGGSGCFVDLFDVSEKELTHTRTVREFFPWDEEQEGRPPLKLVEGEQSDFRGLEFHGDDLLIGIGSRGIVRVPLDPKGKPTQIDVKGSCSDVVLRRGSLYALVQDADDTATELVSLAWKDDWTVTKRHKLNIRAQLFAD